jgi:hypothetical protein
MYPACRSGSNHISLINMPLGYHTCLKVAASGPVLAGHQWCEALFVLTCKTIMHGRHEAFHAFKTCTDTDTQEHKLCLRCSPSFLDELVALSDSKRAILNPLQHIKRP